MKNLQLSLKKNWFEMTKSREKPEDYRAITPYFCKMFLLFRGKDLTKKGWERVLKEGLIGSLCSFKYFEYNIMTLGYPKSTDLERILKLEHKGIEIRTGNPKWGAEPNVLYFVVKHGEIIN